MQAVADEPLLPAPCSLETYAVLTRLPAPHRAAGGVVREFLARNFEGRVVTLSAQATIDVVGTLTELGIIGGAAYDAVVALVAREAGVPLLTLDDRARSTYERIGIEWRLVI